MLESVEPDVDRTIWATMSVARNTGAANLNCTRAYVASTAETSRVAVAAAEMAFAGNSGMTIDLHNVGPDVLPDAVALFSESPSRFLVQVAMGRENDFEKLLKEAEVFGAVVGDTHDGNQLLVEGRDGAELIRESLGDLKEAWQRPLRW